MRILVDADSCSVKNIIETVAEDKQVPVVLFSDYNHQLTSAYSEIVTVQEGSNSADYAIFSSCQKGDIIVTQDIGLASLVLSKGAKAIHPCGRIFSEKTIDYALTVRNICAEGRRIHKRMKSNKRKMEKRTYNFEEIIYVFLTIFLYLLKCPQSLILSALRAFCFCGKSHIPRSIFLYFRYQSWLKSW